MLNLRKGVGVAGVGDGGEGMLAGGQGVGMP